MLGTVLGGRETAVNKTEKDLVPLWSFGGGRQTRKAVTSHSSKCNEENK